jgi:Flp pilus assembly protein TadD
MDILRLNPNDVESRNNLGVLLIQNNQLDEAIVQLQTAIRLQPDFISAQTNLDTVMKMKNNDSH